MSNKVPPEQKGGYKMSKKQQKAAKQQQKIKQGVVKVEKKEFTQLFRVDIKKISEFEKDDCIIVRNKKAEEYADEIITKQQKLRLTIVGFGKQIPKTISVAQIYKRKIGVYDQRKTQIDQKTLIKKDQKGQPLIQISIVRK